MIFTKVHYDNSIKVPKSSSDIIDLPTIVIVNEFNEKSVKTFYQDMDDAISSHQEIVPIVIDSYGGEVYSVLAMVDLIKSCPKPVATIAIGKAMSCGAILLSCGKEGMRYISPTATVMIHEVSSGMRGKVEEIKADSKETERLNTLVMKMIATNCGKHESYFSDIVHEKNHADWFFTPEECINHNLANYIRVPHFEVSITSSIRML